MSHSCWPSFVWQTYDYFFEPTAAYFGCKKGSEPLHIQWNRETETVEVVNYSAGKVPGLTARVEILNMDGTRMGQKTALLDSARRRYLSLHQYEVPSRTVVGALSASYAQPGFKDALFDTFTCVARKQNDFRAIRQLPAPKLDATTTAVQKGDLWELSTKLQNTGASPALMVRVKAVREKTGDRILPAIYSDNYVALMPGEMRTIITEVNEVDTRGEKPTIVLG